VGATAELFAEHAGSPNTWPASWLFALRHGRSPAHYDTLVGRYYGLSTMVFQGCMGLANTIGGIVMDRSLSAVWLIPFAASLCGVAGTLALRTRIPPHVAISA
jgi:hypothetical protein